MLRDGGEGRKKKERKKKNEQVLPSDSADGVRQQGAAARGGRERETEKIILGELKGGCSL